MKFVETDFEAPDGRIITYQGTYNDIDDAIQDMLNKYQQQFDVSRADANSVCQGGRYWERMSDDR